MSVREPNSGSDFNICFQTNTIYLYKIFIKQRTIFVEALLTLILYVTWENLSGWTNHGEIRNLFRIIILLNKF